MDVYLPPDVEALLGPDLAGRLKREVAISDMLPVRLVREYVAEGLTMDQKRRREQAEQEAEPAGTEVAR